MSKCPLETTISERNDAWTSYLNESSEFTETFPEKATQYVLAVRPDTADQLGDQYRLVEDMRSLLSERLTREIDLIEFRAGCLVCRNCSGPVVDMTTGKLHCGQKVPKNVVKTSRLI